MPQAEKKVEQVRENTLLEVLARTGLIAYGLVYLLIGWLALRLAWGDDHRERADPGGAFEALGEQPLGSALLWLIAAGLMALGLWRASESIWGHRDLDDKLRRRLRGAGWALIYVGLSIRSGLVAAGAGGSSSGVEHGAAVGVLSWPGGRTIVASAGLVVVGIGLVELVRGFRKSFREEIDTSSLSSGAKTGVLRLGQVGYVAKGIALGMVGGLLVYAAWTFEVQKASGLDGALKTFLGQPFGRWMLSAMACGFLAFGLFAMLQFRYRRM